MGRISFERQRKALSKNQSGDYRGLLVFWFTSPEEKTFLLVVNSTGGQAREPWEREKSSHIQCQRQQQKQNWRQPCISKSDYQQQQQQLAGDDDAVGAHLITIHFKDELYANLQTCNELVRINIYVNYSVQTEGRTVESQLYLSPQGWLNTATGRILWNMVNAIWHLTLVTWSCLINNP